MDITLLSAKSFEALDEAEKAKDLIRLERLAEVDIGIVTGRNSFFVFSEEKAKELSLMEYTIPIIGRTTALKSVIYTPSDLDEYNEQYPGRMLYLVGIDEEAFSVPLKAYLKAVKKKVYTKVTNVVSEKDGMTFLRFTCLMVLCSDRFTGTRF